MRVYRITPWITAAAFLLATPALARKTGIYGKSKTGCIPCHGAAVTPSVTVTLSGPSELAPGEEGQYTFTVQGGPLVAAGLDVSVEPANMATLIASAAAETQILNSELTHRAPKTKAGGASSVAFTFRVKAGTTTGSVMLYAGGNSVNLDDKPSLSGPTYPDKFNVTSFPLTIKAPTVVVDAGTPGGGGGTVDAGSTSQNPSSPTTPSGGGGSTSDTDEDLPSTGSGSGTGSPGKAVDKGGGCQAAGSSLLGLGLALIAVLGRRRQKRS